LWASEVCRISHKRPHMSYLQAMQTNFTENPSPNPTGRRRLIMAEMKQVIKLLEDIQWFKNGHCPVCGAFTTNGHSKGCEIDQALALLEKQPEATEFTRRFRILLATQDKTVIVQDGYQACNKLDRRAKQINRLEAMYKAAKGDLDDVMDGHKITDDLLIELQAEIKQLTERYIEAVNDFAQMKRNIRKCKCPDCGFGLEQALQEKKDKEK